MSFEFKTYSETEVIVSVKTLSDMEKEIVQLKEQLKREKSAVDFYADKASWSSDKNFGTLLSRITEDDLDSRDSYFIAVHGGKLARETVKARTKEQVVEKLEI